MNIRKALNKDIDVIARYNYNLAYETENKILNMNILTKGVEAIIKDENKGIYHVCEINGEVVGQIMYTFEWSDWRMGHSYGFKVFMLIRNLEEWEYLKHYINL